MQLFIRNLIFTVIQPGIIAGLIPYLILETPDIKSRFNFEKYFSVIIFIIGFLILLKCIIDFGVKGKGTLSPIDPPKKLVINGLYKISRNPMYVGIMLILFSEALFFESVRLWIYSIVIFMAFNIFIILYEEPHLTRDFGNEYEEYKKKVNRWF